MKELKRTASEVFDMADRLEVAMRKVGMRKVKVESGLNEAGRHYLGLTRSEEHEQRFYLDHPVQEDGSC